MTARGARGLWSALLLGGCATVGSNAEPSVPPSAVSHAPPAARFGDDLAFLERHIAPVVLRSEGGAVQVVVAPAYQGRVMTSTAEGEEGASFGYVHRPGVEREKPTPHISVVGGEERFWLGPEGGNFALYFERGAPFDFAHWQVPEALDWGAWPVTAQSEREVRLERDLELMNYHGTVLALHVTRTVRLLDARAVAQTVGFAVPEGVRAVGYESENRVENRGQRAWRRETGLISIWLLGMFPPGPRATVVIPFDAAAQGEVVHDDYFGAIGPDRLRIGANCVFLRADGAARGKIGLPYGRAKDVAGSYDPDARTLTVVRYTLPRGPAQYVSSTWKLQADPYAGDVVNSYNDGPVTPGAAPLGPFYELESSSPALALEPHAAYTHVQRTLHFTGERAGLQRLALATLGVSLEAIESAFASPD